MKKRFVCLLFFICCVQPFSAYSNSKTYYDILGISEKASVEEIKRAYLKLAKKYHPDSNMELNNKAEIEERMKEVNRAYEVLKDPSKRFLYDRELARERVRPWMGGFDKPAGETEDLNNKAGVYQAKWSYSPFTSHLGEKPFAEKSSQNRRAYSAISDKHRRLFLIILVNNLYFKDTWNNPLPNQTDLKKINKAKRGSQAALKEILKSLGITGLNKTTRDRILNDFYHNFSEEKLRELIRQNPNTKVSWADLFKRAKKPGTHVVFKDPRAGGTVAPKGFANHQIALERAFFYFMEDIKNWYTVQNITAQERKALEKFQTLSFLNQDRIDLKTSEDRHLELMRKKLEKKEKLTREEKRELKAFEQQVKKDIRTFRKVLSALGLPAEAYHNIMIRSYMDALKDTLGQRHFSSLLAIENKRAGYIHKRIYIKDAEVLKAIKDIKMFLIQTTIKIYELWLTPSIKTF